jgi:hypothetical protein
MNPIGFGFEHFDQHARFRTEDNEKPVDASGNLTCSDIDGPFYGVRELAERLATSHQVDRCFTEHVVTFAVGHLAGEEDACTVRASLEGVAPGAIHALDLVLDIVRSDAFRHRRSEPPKACSDGGGS